MIKAVVFDIGGVLLEESGKKARKYLAKKYKFSEQKFTEFAKKNIRKSHLGQLTAKQFFTKLIKELEISATPEELIETWLHIRRKTTKKIKGSIRILKKLKKQGYKIACLTDTTILNDKIRNEIGIYDYFDLKILSTKEKAWKPEEKIYKSLIKKIKTKPEEIIFIDDDKYKTKPTKKLKINTIIFENPRQLKRELKKYGVKV